MMIAWKSMLQRLVFGIVMIVGLWITAITPITTAQDAAYYYISPSGSDTNPGSEAAPFLTIQHGIDMARAGDTVFVRAGIYREKLQFDHSGADGQPITLRAYPGEAPVIEGAGVDYADSEYGGALRIYDVRYITVIGLTIQNIQRPIPVDNSYDPPKPTIDGPAGIRVARADHITIQDTIIHNTASSGIHVIDSAYITLDGNTVTLASNGGLQECISLDSVTHFEVKNNTVTQGAGTYWGDEGIDVKLASGFGTIHHNRVYDLPNEVGIYVDGYSESIHDIEVFNNWVYRTGEGIAVGAEQLGSADTVSIHHNVIYDVAGDGILVSDCCTVEQSLKTHILIAHNTVYGNGSAYGGGITVRSTNVADITIVNNIVSQNNNWQLRDKSGSATIQHNLIDGFRAYDQELVGQAAVMGDPAFVNATAYDFRLQAGSPAIDQGIDLGWGADLGAYEAQIMATTTPSAAGQRDWIWYGVVVALCVLGLLLFGVLWRRSRNRHGQKNPPTNGS